MKTYNVLWCDDDYAVLETILDEALVNGIILTGFSNSEETIAELRRNYLKYDAVLLDGLFYGKAEQQGDASSDKPLGEVLTALIRLNTKKFLPKFVLSGQDIITGGGNPKLNFVEIEKVYNKNKDGDTLQLWNDIKIEADKQPYTHIRHKYSNAFEVCTDEYTGQDAGKHIMPILFSIENPGDPFETENHFNALRKVVELVFRAANKQGLLHDKCIPNGIVNLTWASLFMGKGEVVLPNNEGKITCSKVHFNSILAANVKSVLEITSAASHTESIESTNGKVNFAVYSKYSTSPYLLYSLVYHVMDLLLWYKSYADENPNIEANKALWSFTPNSTTIIHSGIISQDGNGNYHCDNYLLGFKAAQNHPLGASINITEESTNNDSRTNTFYPKFATKFTLSN